MLNLRKFFCNNFQNLRFLHNFVQSKCPLPVKSINLLRNGSSADVLEIKEEKLIATDDNQVLLKILAAPIHPFDINFIRGLQPATCKYEPEFPVVPGRECVAEIVSVGKNVCGISVGQRVVVPYAYTISKRGTWSTHALFDANDVVPIPDDIGLPEAATITENPCVAYRILKDFITLNPGDGVLFNGGDSMLGQSLHQLCKAWNLNSFSIVRPEHKKMLDEKLQKLGATKVFTYDELKNSKDFGNGTFPYPLLTISSEKRSSSGILGNFLDVRGVMVAYGCMERCPAAIVSAHLVHDDFVHRPFWIIRWNKNNPDEKERISMITELCNLIRNKQFCAPELELVPFKEFKYAFEELEKDKTLTTKFLLDMRCEDID